MLSPMQRAARGCGRRSRSARGGPRRRGRRAGGRRGRGGSRTARACGDAVPSCDLRGQSSPPGHPPGRASARSEPDADRNEHICLRVVTDAKIVFHVSTDLTAQTDQSKIIGVTGLTLFESENSGLADVPRRDEVGLTDTKRNRLRHSRDYRKEIANTRTGQTCYMVCHKMLTVITH